MHKIIYDDNLPYSLGNGSLCTANGIHTDLFAVEQKHVTSSWFFLVQAQLLPNTNEKYGFDTTVQWKLNESPLKPTCHFVAINTITNIVAFD